MYAMYANASNNIPSYTCVSSYMLWRLHPMESNIMVACTHLMSVFFCHIALKYKCPTKKNNHIVHLR